MFALAVLNCEGSLCRSIGERLREEYSRVRDPWIFLSMERKKGGLRATLRFSTDSLDTARLAALLAKTVGAAELVLEEGWARVAHLEDVALRESYTAVEYLSRGASVTRLLLREWGGAAGRHFSLLFLDSPLLLSIVNRELSKSLSACRGLEEAEVFLSYRRGVVYIGTSLTYAVEGRRLRVLLLVDSFEHPLVKPVPLDSGGEEILHPRSRFRAAIAYDCVVRPVMGAVLERVSRGVRPEVAELLGRVAMAVDLALRDRCVVDPIYIFFPRREGEDPMSAENFLTLREVEEALERNERIRVGIYCPQGSLHRVVIDLAGPALSAGWVEGGRFRLLA